MANTTKPAIVAISGGLDSTTVLAMVKAQGYSPYTITFDYGQRHQAELQAASQIAENMQVPEHKVISLHSVGQLGGSALTDTDIDVPDFVDSPNIPVTYVPARNTIFLAIALGWAEVLGAQDIFIGVNAVDYSHYPDCRPEYIDAFQKMANLATKAGVEGQHVTIHTPLINLSKAEIIQTGIKLGVDYAMTVSCYRATDDGRACGNCDSCTFRKKGFLEANIPDPTRYAQSN